MLDTPSLLKTLESCSKDWVEAQLAIIETSMVTTAQVFLPCAVTNNGLSLYEYISQNTQLLGSGQ